MEGEQSLRRYSPHVMVQDPTLRDAVSLLPPIILFHGTGDYSIPSDARFILIFSHARFTLNVLYKHHVIAF